MNRSMRSLAQALVLMILVVVLAAGQVHSSATITATEVTTPGVSTSLAVTDSIQPQGGTFQFASSSVNVLDNSYAAEGYYQNTLRLVNYSGAPLQAMVFTLVSHGKVIIHPLKKVGLFASSDWILRTRNIRGPIQPDGSYLDTINVVLYTSTAKLIAPVSMLDVFTFGYDVVNIDSEYDETSFELLNILGSTSTTDNALLNGTAEQIINIQNRTITVSGDINFDHHVDVLDLLMIVDHITGKRLLSDREFKQADIDPWGGNAVPRTGNGQVNILDLVLLHKIILDNRYPDGLPLNPEIPIMKELAIDLQIGILPNARITIQIGQSNIDIILDSSMPVKGLQLDLTNIVSLGDKISSTTGLPAFVQLNGSLLRVLMFDARGAMIDPGRYLLASIPVQLVNPSLVEVRDLIVGGSENQRLLVEAQIVREVQPKLFLGDVNQDTYVDIRDLLYIVDHITGKRLLSDSELGRADIYPWQAGDGVVNVLDLAFLEGIILHDQYPVEIAPPIPPIYTLPSPKDSIQPITQVDAKIIFSVSPTGIDIILSNRVPFKGLQVDLSNISNWPERITSTLDASVGLLNNSTLRILVYSRNGTEIKDGRSIIASIPLRISNPAAVSIKNILAAGSDNQILNIASGVSLSQGGTLQFASPLVEVLDKSYARGGYYQDTLRLVNYSGKPLKALQFSLVSNSRVIIQPLVKAGRFSSPEWSLSTNIIHGPLMEDGSSMDTIHVVLFGTGTAEMPAPINSMDVITFGFNVANINEPNYLAKLILSDIYGAANDASNAMLYPASRQAVYIVNRGIWGDINGDGFVDIRDLLMVVDHIIGRRPLNIKDSYYMNADIYPWPANAPEPAPDGIINVSDLILLQNIILYGRYPDEIPLMKAAFVTGSSNNGIKKSAADVDARFIFHITKTGITIRLENAVTFKGLQAQVEKIASARLDSIKSMFGGTCAILNEKILHLIVYDKGGMELPPGRYTIAEIPADIIDPSTVSIQNIKAAGSDNQALSTQVEISLSIVNVPSGDQALLLKDYVLKQNYPNPFNPTTNITFSVPRTSQVRIMIYNMLGQEVRTLFAGQMERGTNTVRWDGKDQSGRSLASGIYVCRMIAGSFVESRKMQLIK